MFSVGEYVVYGTNGICEVMDITTLDMGDLNNEREYYVLESVKQRANRSFVPTDSEKVVIRNVIEKEAAETLIAEVPSIDGLEAMDDKSREARYKEMVKRCECRLWVSLIKTIYNRKQERIAQGKKMTATDERYMKLAQDNLYEELSFALGIDRASAEASIVNGIK